MRNDYIYSEYLNSLQVKFAAGHFFKATSDWQNTETMKLNKIYYVTKGEFSLTIDNTEYKVKKGQLVMIPANQKHSYRLTELNTMEKYWCHFDAIAGSADLFELIETDMIVDIGTDRKLIALFNEMYKSAESSSPLSGISERANLMLIIARYLDACKSVKIKKTPNSVMLSPVIEYMKSHVTENITIAQLSEIVHLHPNYFIRLFKQYFGASPLKYFNMMKIDFTKKLLQNSDFSVENIAKQAGFNDVYTFSKFFKTNMGISPLRYRRNLLDK